MRDRRVLLVTWGLFTVALLAGCTAMIPKAPRELDQDAKRFAPIPGKSSIYFVHYGWRGQDDYWLLLDGRLTGKIHPHTYFLCTVDPGVHRGQVIGQYGYNRAEDSLTTVANALYFVHVDGEMAGGVSLNSIDNEKGMKEVKKASRLREQDILCKLGLPFEPITNVPPGKAVIYVYWPWENLSQKYKIMVGKKDITVLKNGGCFAYVADSGTIHLSAKLKADFPYLFGWGTTLGDVWTRSSAPIDLEVQNGGVYYVKCVGLGKGMTYIAGMPAGFRLGDEIAMSAVRQEVGSAEARCCAMLPDAKGHFMKRANHQE